MTGKNIQGIVEQEEEGLDASQHDEKNRQGTLPVAIRDGLKKQEAL